MITMSKYVNVSGKEVLELLSQDFEGIEGFVEESNKWIPISYFTILEVQNDVYKFRHKKIQKFEAQDM